MTTDDPGTPDIQWVVEITEQPATIVEVAEPPVVVLVEGGAVGPKGDPGPGPVGSVGEVFDDTTGESLGFIPIFPAT